MTVIGIDLGTTRIKVAHIDETGRPRIVLNRRGDPYTPSAVFFEDGRHPIVGTEALMEGLIQPEHVHTCVKRVLGSRDVLYSDADGKSYNATDLTAIQIAWVKEDVENRFNVKVEEAVISVPANFKDHQKQATIDAAAASGINVLKLVNEPTAAGIAYALEKKRGKPFTFLVYDLGGGTFDVSVLQVADDSITVLNSAGRQKLGGEDFNARLEEQIVQRFAEKHGYTPTLEADAIFFQELAEKVENAKIALSQKSRAKLVIGCRGQQLIFECTREEFEGWTADLLQETLQCTTQAVTEAALTMDDLHTIVLVGGAVRMPAVQSALADHTGIVPHSDIEPDRAVAYGAALQCAIEMARGGKTLMIGGRLIPAPSAFVQEVTVHGVGCCVVGNDDELTNAIILPKGTRIPTHKTDRFALQYDDQTEAHVEVLQGEEGQLREECLSIGEIVLQNLPPECKRSKRIEVTYSIDNNGMIRATGKDLVGGETVEIDIDYKSGTATQASGQSAA